MSVTDDPADLFGDDALPAAIAHEFAHVDERHGLALRVGGLVFAVSMVAVGDASLIEELAALAVSTARFRYSRRFEREADASAARFPEAAGRRFDDPARALAALQRARGHACERDGGWFSTQPRAARCGRGAKGGDVGTGAYAPPPRRASDRASVQALAKMTDAPATVQASVLSPNSSHAAAATSGNRR